MGAACAYGCHATAAMSSKPPVSRVACPKGLHQLSGTSRSSDSSEMMLA